MHHYQLYIFDWDGTLMNSIDKIVNSMQYAATLADLTVPSVSQCKSIIGAGMKEAADILFPGASLTSLKRLQDHYRQRFIELNSKACPLYPGTEQLIQNLHSQGKKLAIATSKGRPGLDNVLAQSQLARFFHTSRTADDAKAKPHPDMLEQILAELNINAKQALYIGDSRFDIDMANNAGMDSIAVSHGAGDIETLNASKPTILVHSTDELKRLIINRS
ncbi:HAD-IIIA family hydrolase [Thalassotalea sp. Y01]|uniref:HAD family hydrolase n=1 Tax=Thalassotalea sp. Y01 TaxID=2729613 RepID=UPI00145F644F|nr:HAD-IIIA family hydrolase [Thalassotalea sp. Y01]NMP16878.1 HAD-IIIA family hydrolase [Thalassotalea sp. Y01]